jgi:hypothetical protein
MSNVIKTVAHPNELTKDVKNDFYLQHQPVGTLYTADIIQRLENKQIATNNVNGPAFVRLFHAECILAVGEGYNVVTELCCIRIGIHGVVYSQDLGHNVPADRVNLRMVMTQSAEARSAVKNMTVQVGEQPAPSGPVIQSIYNPVQSEPDTLNTGAMGLIQGLRIAVRGDSEEEIGVFFTSVADGTVVHVAADQLAPNTPSKLQFVLPAAVVAGEWTVAVATQSTGQNSLSAKKVRRYDYPNVISVV